MTYSHPSPPSPAAVESSNQMTALPLPQVPAIAVPDEDTLSRTILALAPADLTWLHPGAIAGELPSRLATVLAAVETAIVPLLDILTHLRSPQGDWPADLAWTPANLYPYVADEVCEVLEAYQTALAATAPPATSEVSPIPPAYWLLRDLAPRLLWAIAHSSAALMNLLSGVTAAMLTPQGEWQGGLLRLVGVLTATPTETTAASWAVDLAVQRPPLAGIPPDRRLQVGSLLPTWSEGTADQLLTQLLTEIEQDQPSLAHWFRGVTGDWLVPGTCWRSGTVILQCSLEFIPLPTLVTATTASGIARVPSATEEHAASPDLTPPVTPPRSGVAIPLDLADLDREEGEGDIEGETTIFFLDDDDDEAAVDLMPPFPATVLAAAPESPTSPPLTAASFLDPEAPADTGEPTSWVDHEPDPSVGPLDLAVAAAPDSSDSTLLTVSAMFPDLPHIGTPVAAGGPIARVRGARASTIDDSPTETLRERPAVWREAALRSHLLTHFLTWQRLGLITADDASAMMPSDPEPEPAVLAILETACAIVPYLTQPELGLFLPVLEADTEEGGYALNDWLQGLFWAVTRSTYTIAQLVGGVYAQVLQPEQGWQTGTLRLVVLLTIAHGVQQWVWDLGTRQRLTAPPQWLSPDAIVCLDHQPAYPNPIRLANLQTQLLAQLRASEPRLTVWETGLPMQWQATTTIEATEATETTEAITWQSGQWHLTCNLEFVATP